MITRPTKDEVCSQEAFLYFVQEREAVRIKRGAGVLAPWTEDPVLQRYKFTNIRRKHDRVSQWVIEHLIQPGAESGDEDLWFTLLVARLVNWPPTLARLIRNGVLPCRPEDFDAERFVTVLERCKAEGAKVYSGAYMLYPTKMQPGGKKSAAVAKYIIGDAVRRARATRSALWAEDCVFNIERFVGALSAGFGVSTFIAGQVAADLTYTGMDVADLYTYAPLGPGSQQGLNFIFGYDKYHGWKQAKFNSALMLLNERIKGELGVPDLTLHDVQNCACEFSKYCRAVLGTGKPKSLYKPETEF